MLIRGMTEKNITNRFELITISQILEYMRSRQYFANEILNEEYTELMLNYIVNIDSAKNRNLPIEFKKITNGTHFNNFKLETNIVSKIKDIYQKYHQFANNENELSFSSCVENAEPQNLSSTQNPILFVEKMVKNSRKEVAEKFNHFNKLFYEKTFKKKHEDKKRDSVLIRTESIGQQPIKPPKIFSSTPKNKNRKLSEFTCKEKRKFEFICLDFNHQQKSLNQNVKKIEEPKNTNFDIEQLFNDNDFIKPQMKKFIQPKIDFIYPPGKHNNFDKKQHIYSNESIQKNSDRIKTEPSKCKIKKINTLADYLDSNKSKQYPKKLGVYLNSSNLLENARKISENFNRANFCKEPEKSDSENAFRSEELNESEDDGINGRFVVKNVYNTNNTIADKPFKRNLNPNLYQSQKFDAMTPMNKMSIESPNATKKSKINVKSTGEGRLSGCFSKISGRKRDRN